MFKTGHVNETTDVLDTASVRKKSPSGNNMPPSLCGCGALTRYSDDVGSPTAVASGNEYGVNPI